MTTEAQLYAAIRTKLVARKWAGDAGNDYVFARKIGAAGDSQSVLVVGHDPDDVVERGLARSPFALIYPGRVECDPDQPDWRRVDFAVVVGVSAMGVDPTGEVSMVGGHQTEGVGSSVGRGVVEVAEEVVSVVGHLVRADGIVAVAYLGSFDEPEILDAMPSPLATRALHFSAHI